MLTASYQIDDHLALTEVRLTDVQSLSFHINDREVYKNTLTVPFPYTADDAKFFVGICRKFEELNDHICNYAIRLDGEMIGGIGFLYNHGPEAHKSEFGYWLGQEFRNQGIMTKVINRFVEIAFEEKKLFRLEANVFTYNVISQKLLEKCGFTKEGRLKSTFIKEDRLVDTFLYAKINNSAI